MTTYPTFIRYVSRIILQVTSNESFGSANVLCEFALPTVQLRVGENKQVMAQHALEMVRYIAHYYKARLFTPGSAFLKASPHDVPTPAVQSKP